MQIEFPWIYVPDPTSGRPVALGEMFFGLPDLDPEIPANQIQVSVRQEDGVLIPVTQPILLNAGGVPSYAGSPVIIDIIEGEFSWKVLDSLGGQVYYNENNLPLVITGANIADGSITTEKIADGAVTPDKIPDNSIGEDKVTFTLPAPAPAPYSGGLIPTPWNFLTTPTSAPITQPEALNINPTNLGFMLLDKANSTLYEFETPYDGIFNPIFPNDAALTTRFLALGGQLAGTATCHWMPLAGDVSVAGGDSGVVYQYTWSTPWQSDTAFYSGISFDHSAQTGGVCHSLTLSDDFTHMYIASGVFIYQYTLALAGDISTAVLTGTLDVVATLPALPANSGGYGGQVSWWRCDGGLMMDKENGEWFSFQVKTITSPPWTTNLQADSTINEQASGSAGYTMKLSTPLDITTGTLREDGRDFAPSSGFIGGFSGGVVPNNTFIFFFPDPIPIPYEGVSPWADRRGITDWDSPTGFGFRQCGYGTDTSQYFILVNTPYTVLT